MSCLLPPVCAFCAHLLNKPDQDCRAFREIPDSIMTGNNDHTEPMEGDGGLCFELLAENHEEFAEINALRQEMGLAQFRSSNCKPQIDNKIAGKRNVLDC